MKKLVLGAFMLTVLSACNSDDELQNNDVVSSELNNKSLYDKSCSYVDNAWPSTATLSTTLTSGAGTSADANLMFSQNTAIKNFWRGTSAPTPYFRFVRNGTNWNSTWNARSYYQGYIYYGEGIFRAAKSYDPTNLVNVLILAHEYGHQLQFTFGLPSQQESTARSLELEADGMAGYYLRKGYGKNSFTEISKGYEFAASIGDNNTTDPGHHGTSAQRRSAVRLGFLLANPTNPKLSATQFDYNFFYYYNGVLNGTYKMAQPQNVDKATHEMIMSHMDELVKLKSGEMSDSEYFKLQ